MAKPDFPHVFPVQWDDVITFDRAGIGATSKSSIAAAMWVAMRPSVFLSIATPLPVPRASLDWLRGEMDAGRAIAPAELRFDVFGSMPLALSHEGRHRMTALREKLSDCPVPVRLSFKGMHDHEIDDRFVSFARNAVKSQRGRSVVAGPLFDEAEVDEGGRYRSGVPPDAWLARYPAREVFIFQQEIVDFECSRAHRLRQARLVGERGHGHDRRSQL
jgi:hypothetical protein